MEAILRALTDSLSGNINVPGTGYLISFLLIAWGIYYGIFQQPSDGWDMKNIRTGGILILLGLGMFYISTR
jgi:hypothetical protein